MKKQMTEKLKTNKGITLIALVITIIVMLILVAVTISMAVNGGLFSQAGRATGETENAIDNEHALGSGRINVNGLWYNSIDDYLNNKPAEEQENPNEGVIEPPQTYAYSFQAGDDIIAYVVVNEEETQAEGTTVYDMLFIGYGEMYSVRNWNTDILYTMFDCAGSEVTYKISVENIKISEGITNIPDYAFMSSSVTEILIPSSVTTIGVCAFKDCSWLTNVYFEQINPPTFGNRCFMKYFGDVTTFHFKNDTVYNAFTTNYYSSSYGTKSTDYNW